jgi:isopenicillin-N epimerase
LASFIGADPEEVVFVVNATTGINSVIRSLDLQQGDSVLCLDLTYRPVLNTLRFVCTVRQELVELVELPIPLPLPTSDDIVRMVQEALTKHPNVRLAVFDHITSPTALVLPVARLASLCRKRNVTVLIDGAHAPGQIPLNMKEIGADFYVGKIFIIFF